MDCFFFRFEIAPTSGALVADRDVEVVVIVDRDELSARKRLRLMHPQAVVRAVESKPFVIPEHRKVPGGPHRNPAAHRQNRNL